MNMIMKTMTNIMILFVKKFTKKLQAEICATVHHMFLQ